MIHNSLDDFDANALQGLWQARILTVHESSLFPPTDVNGNGTTTDVGDAEVDTFRNNPAGLNVKIEPPPYNY